MTPNTWHRSICGIALAVIAFGLMGCHVERKPKPPKGNVVVQVNKNGHEKTTIVQIPGGLEVPDVPPVPDVPQVPDVPPVPEVAGFPGPIRIIKAPQPPRPAEAVSVNMIKSQPVIRLTAIRSSNPRPNKELALQDALNVARTELMKQLDLLEPPIHTKPSMVTMKQNYIKGEVREILPSESEKEAIRASGLNSNVRWVEIDLELTESQVQKLRSAERVTDAFRMGALLFALIAAVYGFLRLDQWTKGYLTMWLGLGAGAAVVVAALMLLG